MKPQKRKGSCTSKREISLEIQERIYQLAFTFSLASIFDMY